MTDVAGGHTVSAKPPSTIRSADCSRASNRPRIATRGCSLPSSPRKARRLILPHGKDIAEFHQAGGNVLGWLQSEMTRVGIH